MYVVFILMFIVIFVLTKLKIFTDIESALFIENNQKWFKLNNYKTISQEGFCYANAQNDGSLKTEDFAMLETLPRLYGLTNDGKCYIKPSKRGLFNTTMKYIFGKDYEKDNILIMCKKISHYPMLILTSDKIMNKTISYFSSNETITFFDKQFDINNTNYFDNITFDNLTKECQAYYTNYDKCVKVNGTINCEEKWDLFTQCYWPNTFTDMYENISGFERYQINIGSSIIQPSFIVNDNETWSGTHYIIGGGYEDEWGLGLLIETLGQNYVSNIFSNIIPFYSTSSVIFRDAFLYMEYMNRYVLYYEIFTSNEINEINDLYSQFNFSNQLIYTIGHSISGTAFKSISYSNGRQGIAFESLDGAKNSNIKNMNELQERQKKRFNSYNQITNIYSNSIFSGFDSNCDVNGKLLKRYTVPNVYDTACLTAITCSDKMKYVPFCLQILSSDKKKSELQFNESFNAYLKFYGFQ